MDPKTVNKVLKIIAENPDATQKILDSELSLPNIKFPTLGGENFWTELGNFNGYRLQQNDITKHARLLDPENVRIAWGTVNGMNKALNRIRNSITQERDSREAYAKNRSDAAIEKLMKLKELLDIGAITQSEYEAKKLKLIDDI